MLISLWLAILFLQSPTVATDLCSAAETNSSAVIVLRGTGGKSDEGPILFDYTCPIGRGNDFIMPTVALVPKPVFDDAQFAELYRALTSKKVFQALVEGRLECKKPLQVVK